MCRFHLLFVLISICYGAPRRNLANFEDLASRPPASDFLEDPTSILLPFFRPGALANPSSFLNNKLTASGNSLDISQFLETDFLHSFKPPKDEHKDLKPIVVVSDQPVDKDIGRVFAGALKNLFRRTQISQLEDFQLSAMSQLNSLVSQIQTMTTQFGSLFSTHHLNNQSARSNGTYNSTTAVPQTSAPAIPFVFADDPKSAAPTNTKIVGDFPEISLNIDTGSQSFDRETDAKLPGTSRNVSTKSTPTAPSSTSAASGSSNSTKIVTVDLNDFVLQAEFLSDLLKEKGGLKTLMDLLNDPVARKSILPGL